MEYMRRITRRANWVKANEMQEKYTAKKVWIYNNSYDPQTYTINISFDVDLIEDAKHIIGEEAVNNRMLNRQRVTANNDVAEYWQQKYEKNYDCFKKLLKLVKEYAGYDTFVLDADQELWNAFEKRAKEIEEESEKPTDIEKKMAE